MNSGMKVILRYEVHTDSYTIGMNFIPNISIPSFYPFYKRPPKRAYNIQSISAMHPSERV